MWPWVTGAFILLTGLIVIAFHQYWRGTAAIIVSALGWMTALKGLFLMAFPQTYLSAANSGVDAVTWWRLGFVVMAVVGLYLTYVGWAPAPSRPASRTERVNPGSAPRRLIAWVTTRGNLAGSTLTTVTRRNGHARIARWRFPGGPRLYVRRSSAPQQSTRLRWRFERLQTPRR